MNTSEGGEATEGAETATGSKRQRSKALITACYLCALGVQLLAVIAKKQIFIIIPVSSRTVCVFVCIITSVDDLKYQ